MKKIKGYKCFGLIVIIGIIDISFGIFNLYKHYNFINDANKTTGNIYSILNNKQNKLLYVSYYVNNKQYNGVIVTNDDSIKISDTIPIYYDKNNPKKISNGEVKYLEIITIILGLFVVLIGILLILVNYKKQIEKTINV